MLYNILLKSGNHLSPIDDTLEMELAIILESLREQLLQKVIPQDHKDRIEQVDFIKAKIQHRLRLITSGEKKSETDEKMINLCYKRMSDKTLMSFILDGGGSPDIYYYINSHDQKVKHTIAYHIPKHQGYNNPEVLINHVHEAINNANTFKVSLLKDRLLTQLGDMDHYFDESTGSITRKGVKALLYATGYLKAGS